MKEISRNDFQSMDTAPKGNYSKYTTDPEWVSPPKILMLFEAGDMCVVSWDWYYSEEGEACFDGVAWVEPINGTQANLQYGEPVGWLPLPQMP